MLLFLLFTLVLLVRGAWPTAQIDEGFVWKVQLERQEVPVVKDNRVIAQKTAYFGNVSVGSPAPQNFTVLFDTGSAHVFLPSSVCQDTACSVHRNYDRMRSSSAVDIDHSGAVVPIDGSTRDIVSISYGTGSISGDFVNELVCLGGPETQLDDAAPCTRVRLIQAHHMSTVPFADFGFDGVLGLGLDALALHREFNFFSQLRRTVGMQPRFGVFLAGTEACGACDGPAGEIVFGGHDANRARGPLNWVPVADPEKGHWQVRVVGISVGNESLDVCGDGGCVAIVDTGTSLLGVPRDLARTLNLKMVRWAGPGAHENPELNCRSVPGPAVRLDLEGFSIRLEAEDYTRPAAVKVPPVDGHGDPQVFCRASLLPVAMPAIGTRVFLLGEPVLRKYYTVFNARDEQIGFAPAAAASSSKLGERQIKT